MTNGLVQHMSVEESTSIQWVKVYGLSFLLSVLETKTVRRTTSQYQCHTCTELLKEMFSGDGLHISTLLTVRSCTIMYCTYVYVFSVNKILFKPKRCFLVNILPTLSEDSNKSSAEQGNIHPWRFLVWKKTLQYLNLVSDKNLHYVLRQINRNGSLIQRGSIMSKLKVGL